MSNAAFDQYQTFMQALFAPSDTVCFAFIKEANGKKEIFHDFVPATRAFGEDFFETLEKGNKTFNVYVAMNPFKAELVGQIVGRTKTNVAAVKRLYAEVDINGAAVLKEVQASTITPPPNVILESSPGKFQFIWNVARLTQETAEPLLKALAQHFNTDPGVTEIARVLRRTLNVCCAVF